MTKGELSPERLLRLAPAARDRVAGTGAAAAAALSAPGSSLASSACAAELLVVQQRIVGGLCLDFGRVRSTYIHTCTHSCVVLLCRILVLIWHKMHSKMSHNMTQMSCCHCLPLLGGFRVFKGFLGPCIVLDSGCVEMPCPLPCLATPCHAMLHLSSPVYSPSAQKCAPYVLTLHCCGCAAARAGERLPRWHRGWYCAPLQPRTWASAAGQLHRPCWPGVCGALEHIPCRKFPLMRR